MTPLDYYRKQCISGAISEDKEQLIALTSMQRIYQDLVNEQKKRFGWTRLLHKTKLVHGLYLWGGVGVGKTFMMDCFYHCLPFPQKLRMHFHQFMHRIHQELKHHQGDKDPLQVIASELAKETVVICFDEFYVSDITDASILGRLLEALFKRGVCLVATSNTAPDDLYKNGLQRLRFLPAIALIKKNTEVLHIPTTVDYRLQYLTEAGVFYTPLDQAAAEHMQKSFAVFAEGSFVEETPIALYGRSINVKKRTPRIIWFDFHDICSIPRSQNDYLALAEQYHTVFISDIPEILPESKDTICLFIKLVDVFYDAKVRLVISAAQPIPELYNQGAMVVEYMRTHSRLMEMQSTDYFMGDITKDFS